MLDREPFGFYPASGFLQLPGDLAPFKPFSWTPSTWQFVRACRLHHWRGTLEQPQLVHVSASQAAAIVVPPERIGVHGQLGTWQHRFDAGMH